jgi:adenylate cyclase
MIVMDDVEHRRLTPEISERTFIFIDLAGFTTMTFAHGDEDAANVAERLTELARTELKDGDELVKSIGDAVMLTSPTPSAGLALVARICHRADDEDAFPALRAGLHHGPAVPRGDDWFGTTINLAARIAAQAAPGQVLGSQAIADAATSLGVPGRPLGVTRLRGMPGGTALYEVIPCAPVDRVIDPVCRMAVHPRAAASQVEHDGTVYWFCSLSWAAAFAAAPSDHSCS